MIFYKNYHLHCYYIILSKVILETMNTCLFFWLSLDLEIQNKHFLDNLHYHISVSRIIQLKSPCRKCFSLSKIFVLMFLLQSEHNSCLQNRHEKYHYWRMTVIEFKWFPLKHILYKERMKRPHYRCRCHIFLFPLWLPHQHLYTLFTHLYTQACSRTVTWRTAQLPLLCDLGRHVHCGQKTASPTQ